MAKSAKARAAFWRPKITDATTGEDALDDAWRWLRSELKVMADERPGLVDQARRDLADQMAKNAALLPRYKPGGGGSR